jgi:hypothetical protein
MPLPHWPFEDPSSTPKVLPFQSPEAEEEQRLRNLPPELRRAERSKRALERPEARVPRYPPDCRPAAEVIQRLLPHYVTPVVRPLAPAPMELGRALLRATQERSHLLPGEAATLTIEVAVDSRRVPFEVKGGEIVQPSSAPGTRAESFASVIFKDDGVAPDTEARDGVATARVSIPPRLRDFDGELRVRADVSTASEAGEIVFPLHSTPAAPAVFTGTVREAVENGSLAFYVGIRPEKSGRYTIVGRIYDSKRRAMAVLTTNAEVRSSDHEVRLALCGELLRDEAVEGPWELRDVEGFRFAEVDGKVEKTPMATWSGPHRTLKYPLETFSQAAKEKPALSAPREVDMAHER